MREAIKQEIHQLVDVCNNEMVLEGAKNLLMSAVILNDQRSLTIPDIEHPHSFENKPSIDEVFGLWKNRNVSLDKTPEKQWERKAG